MEASGIRPLLVLVAFTCSVFFLGCSLQRNWSMEQRLGLGPNEYLISVPYDPFAGSASDRDKFPLYYFTSAPFDKNKPTILFCAGGPGAVPSNQTANYLDSLKKDYNIVYFHPRGSGYSQLPPSNSYDQYLRIRFAVEDIEAIRLSLGITRWHAVVGYSYGSVLAHQYAGMYGKGGQMNTDNLDKLVLIAPMSRGGILRPADAADLMERTKKQERINLERIYQIQFPGIQDFNKQILDAIQRIQDNVERKFGSLQFVNDEYEQLRHAQGRDLLKENSLDYSQIFLAALRRLRFLGWFPGVLQREQALDGIVIATELGCKIPDFDWTVLIRKKPISYCSSADTINKLSSIEPSIWLKPRSKIDANEIFSTTRKKQLLLEEIYRNNFRELTNEQISLILQEIARVIDVVYERYGGLEFVIEKYQDIIKGPVGKAVPYNLVFFKALQAVIYSDRVPSETKSQNMAYAAFVIGREVAKGSPKFNGFASRQEFVFQGRTVPYTEAEESVSKLTLRAPSEVKLLRLLGQVYDNEFEELQEYRNVILSAVTDAQEFARTRLGDCLGCIVENYDALKGDLTVNELDYDKQFFVALQNFAELSMSADQAAHRMQRQFAASIGKEVACYTAKKAIENKEKSKLPTTITCDGLKEILDYGEATSPRVYNVVSIYDGLQPGFLKEWLVDKSDFRRALTKSAGEVYYEACKDVDNLRGDCRYGPNQDVQTIGVIDGRVQIEPWDPARYMHEVPTLILKGGADPVTVGNQPEYVISHALRGARMMITLPGAGHELQRTLAIALTTESPISANPESLCYGSLSGVNLQRTYDGNPMDFTHSNWFACLISSFLELEPEYFQQAKILNAIKAGVQKVLKDNKVEGDNHVETFVCQKSNDWCYKS